MRGQAQSYQGRYKSPFYDWGEALVISLTIVALVFTFAVRLISVIGPSMMHTLEDGDKIVLISNLLYRNPQKGDIVVIQKDGFYENKPIVKRIIATAGDMLEIDFSTGAVHVNGEKLEEPYVNPETVPPIDRIDMVSPQTVPAGCVFVMGDNRNRSTDSRDSRLGMVDTRYIAGHVIGRVAPFSSIGAVS